MLQAACQFIFSRKTGIISEISAGPAVFDRRQGLPARQKLPGSDKVLTVDPYQWHPE